MKKLFYILFLLWTIPLTSNTIYSKKTNKMVGNENSKFKLITCLYNEINPERLREYIICLEKNLAHDLIDTVHIIYDTSKDNENNILLSLLKDLDVTISYINERPSYQYCFDLANTLYPNSKVILSNADIYFNHTLQLLENYDLRGKFLALTRWNITQDGTLEPYKVKNIKNIYENNINSQDTWIFVTPITEIECDNIQLGTKHCDGRIAYEANKSNYKVLNPCLTIQCCHLQLSEIRNYIQKPREINIVMSVSWDTLPADIN